MRALKGGGTDEQRQQLAQLSRISLLDEFFGAVAHELNQPLTAILSNAEAAARLLTHESIDVSSLRQALDDILTSGRHAIEVVQTLRELLRSGEAQYLPLDLNETALSALALARTDVARHQVQVETKLEPSLGRVRGDRVQVQQVVLNLIVNACESMVDTPAAQRRLLLTTRHVPQSSKVELSVRDYGVGIEPSQLERIFQPFVTTKRNGLGLGLSISRSIIKAHGGKIWAENTSTGAMFCFTLLEKK